MDTVADVLKRMLVRFSEGQAWCHIFCARDQWGQNAYESGAPAVAWCLVGALSVEAIDQDLNDRARAAMENVIGKDALACWNDAQPDFAPVKEMLLTAIQKLNDGTRRHL